MTLNEFQYESHIDYVINRGLVKVHANNYNLQHENKPYLRAKCIF